MLMSNVFADNLFNDFFGDTFENRLLRDDPSFYGTKTSSVMKTDIKEADGAYAMEIELPGYKKEDVSAKLENGYLIIAAKHQENKDEQDEKGNYIHRERYVGQCSRSYYVGDAIKQADIKAKFEDGVLKLVIPKEEPEKLEQNKFIAIEG